MDLSLGLLFAFLSMIGLGTFSLFVKRVIKEAGEYTSLFYTYLIEVFILLLTAVCLTRIFIPDLKTILLILFAGAFGAANIYVFYKALNISLASVVNPIAASATIFTLIASYFFFNEKLSFLQYIMVVVVIIGVVLISIKKSELEKGKKFVIVEGALLALLAALGFSAFSLCTKVVVDKIGGLLSAFYLEFAVFLFLLSPLLIKKAEIKKIDFFSKKILFLGGLMLALGAGSFKLGIMFGSLSLVAAVGTAAPLVSVMGAKIFLKEKAKLNQYIGALVIILALFGLSLL